MGEPKLTYTVEEYLELDKNSLDTKYEYYYGSVIAMAGANGRHNEVCFNITSAFKQQVKKRGCRVFMESMKVATANRKNYFYPDVVLTCNPLEMRDSTLQICQSPSLIVEVLSKSTMNFDIQEKLLEYTNIPTLTYYLLVNTTYPFVNCYVRKEEDWWAFKIYTELTEVISLDLLDLQLSMADIYEGITLDAPSYLDVQVPKEED